MTSPIVYFGKRGEMRLYSSSDDGSGGKRYYQVAFEQMDFAGTAGRPRPDEIPVLDRGNYNSFTHHIQGPDTPIIAPVQLRFTAMIDNTINRFNLLRAMGNVYRESPWQVNGFTFSNVNGTTTLLNGAGSTVSTALPFDTQQDRVHLCIVFRGDPQQVSGVDDYGWNFREVYFQPGQIGITEAADRITINGAGWCYGPISHMSAFDAGTDISR